jgi:streptogramin lyase
MPVRCDRAPDDDYAPLMRTRAVLVVVLVAACLGLPGPASASYVSAFAGFSGATNGIARGADGNYWVVEEFNDSVARMSPSGAVLGRYPVGDAPTSVAAGPGGKIWVAVTGADQLAVLDTTAPSPVAKVIPTPSTCGPVAIVDGGDGLMYFSLPAQSCADPSRLGSVSAVAENPTPTVVTPGGLGPVFDLAVSGGKLFAPDVDNDVVRRFTLGTTPISDGTLDAPAGSGPEGITVDGAGRLWVTAFNTGQVLRFAPTAIGTLTPISPTWSTPTSAFGIAAAPDGTVYVAGADSKQIVRISTDGTAFTFYPTPDDSRPRQIANGPDGDLFITDQLVPRVLRLVDTAPRTTAPTVNAKTVSASVDPRGNDTEVVFDYGTSKKYGTTTPATALPKTAGATTVTQALKGLKPGTKYHVRIRATNALGVTTSADVAFRAPAKRGGAVLRTKSASGGRTAIKTLVVTALQKGDRVGLRCQGGGCTVKASPTKTLKAKKAGSLSLTKLVKGLVLAPGAKLTITVRLKGAGQAKTVYTMVKGKKPKSR